VEKKENKMDSILSNSIKDYIKNRTAITNFMNDKFINSVDNKHIICLSANNMLLLINGLRDIMKDKNVICVPLNGGSSLGNSIGAVVYYELEDGEHTLILHLPLDFCENEDLRVFKEWVESGTKYLDGLSSPFQLRKDKEL